MNPHVLALIVLVASGVDLLLALDRSTRSSTANGIAALVMIAAAVALALTVLL